jgi:hypothetical protein
MFTMAMSVGADGGDLVVENVGDSNGSDVYESRSRTRMVANIDMPEDNVYAYEGVN